MVNNSTNINKTIIPNTKYEDDIWRLKSRSGLRTGTQLWRVKPVDGIPISSLDKWISSGNTCISKQQKTCTDPLPLKHPNRPYTITLKQTTYYHAQTDHILSRSNRPHTITLKQTTYYHAQTDHILSRNERLHIHVAGFMNACT